MRWHGMAHWAEQLIHIRHPLQVHQALQGLLPLLDADGFWLFLDDAASDQHHQFSAGLSADAHRFMAAQQNQDLYLQRYLAEGLSGQCVTLQSLLRSDELERVQFLTRFQPHFAFPHSLGLILPLGRGRRLGLSCHRRNAPFHSESEHTLSAIGAMMVPWAQLWLGPSTPCQCGLTLAETQVMDLLLQGLDGSEIAQRRGVSKETVKSQIKSLLHKTDCRHQNQLISKMHRQTAREM
ncbi:helix-turn-helix transcriptional regulator [Ferrimonas balearica]|uniref:helix-turn-helix transcriptional regulator n=1 Tax=Ferrimonas balearica TaxID=44012 RepID=UPI001C964D4A|nr:helix-turn-helix transcriptional regulator [Ferrimonas balearica]MBY6224047.1 helix-turn-helix transcriptional regulator [Ferrimonas balearica]